ncbi:MAG: hypothetical protein HETSPECPRED_003376 [Heterodermia speciosa]|uniref:Uncharacterized protein n=1 Tax=Heterodermia speciosa TaxID=116794 RepID=A0A8H3I8D2_9LECA|nr:MAG: hypothetical protein HETSPECPRED_003376 [Heterodermia speciosa]
MPGGFPGFRQDPEYKDSPWGNKKSFFSGFKTKPVVIEPPPAYRNSSERAPPTYQAADTSKQGAQAKDR